MGLLIIYNNLTARSNEQRSQLSRHSQEVYDSKISTKNKVVMTTKMNKEQSLINVNLTSISLTPNEIQAQKVKPN